jgi:hypothetical protein
MGKCGFADAGDVFEQEVPAREESHDAHLDDLRFTFDHSGNVLLDGPNGFR